MVVKIVESTRGGGVYTDVYVDALELAEGDQVSYLGDPSVTLTVVRTTATQVITTRVGASARVAEGRFHRTGRLAGAPLGGTTFDRLVPLEHPRCKLARAQVQVQGMWRELDHMRRELRSQHDLETLLDRMEEVTRIVAAAREAMEVER